MSKLLLHGWAILLLTFGMSACSLVPNELTTAENLIENAPDSALNILRHLSPTQYKSDKNRALYGLLMIETLGKKKLPMKPDSLLDFSIDYYSNHPDGNRLATCYLYKGRIFKYNSQYEIAMQYYLKALDEIKTEKENILLGRINFDMGDICSIQGDFVVARQKYKLAYDNFSKAKLNQLAYYALLYLGKTYHDAKDYKTAETYYRSILSQAVDSLQKGALYQEMGLNFYDDKKTDSALYYFRKVISFPYVTNNRSMRYYLLANIYFDLKQIDSAFYYAYNSFKYEPLIRTQRDCYRILTNSEFLKGHLREMSMYMNRYVNLSDSIRKIDAQIKGSYMETTHIAKKEANENKVQKWISWIVLFLATVAFVFLLRFIFRKVRKEKKEIIKTHTGEKVSIHKKVIGDKRAELQQQIEDRKKQMLAEYKNAGSAEREKQLRNIYKELLHYDKPDLFYPEMDKLLNGVITKLRTRFSTLKENELMLCCYILLHIPTYDMIILFEYKSDEGLKSLKKRLPKKLNLENITLLEEFLLTILSENL